MAYTEKGHRNAVFETVFSLFFSILHCKTKGVGRKRPRGPGPTNRNFVSSF